MKEEPTMAETEQGDPVSVEGEADAEKTVKNSPVKRGRGRPHGSKNKTVSASDLLQDSEDPNGPPRRRRGRPKGHKTKPTEPSESRGEQAEIAVSAHRGRGRPKGSKNRRSTDFGTKRELSLRKRGRPKGSGAIRRPAANDLLNGGSDARKRGRPKGSLKRKTESLTSKEKDEGGCPRKRGRPKGARNKRSRMEREYSDWDAEAYRMQRLLKTVRHRPRKPLAKFSSGASRTVSTKAHRGRGRPRKDPDLSQPAKRGRGRPKGSLNKNPSSLKAHGTLENPHKTSGRPTKGRRPGRPRLQSGKRGRPRKYPLPPPEELRKPKVWKRLGRPRKYPREDQLQEASSAPRRGRGRPRKSESKKGAHLRKNTAATPSTQRAAGPQGKKGRPGRDNGAVRKRGRPKGSLNKNKLRGDETLQNHSVAQGGCPAVGTGTGQELMETGETEGTVPGASLDISESA